MQRLAAYLCQKFGIPFTLPPASRRPTYDPDFFCRFSGIAAHQNFRPDKLDVGPAWNWDSLLPPAETWPQAA